MLTNDDLLAISELLDVKLDAKFKTAKDDLEKKLSNTKIELSNEIADVRKELSNINLILETDIRPRLQHIEQCYTSTFDRYSKGVNQMEALQADVTLLKRIVQEHSEQLKAL